MSEQTKKPVCAVVGVGPGNGAAFARRMAADGYAVALLARSEGTSKPLAAELPGSRAYACDVSSEASIKAAFDAIEHDLGPAEVVIYNAGSGVFGGIDDIKPAQFEEAWRVNTYGAFCLAQRVVPAMRKAGKGSIVFIGATASKRGVPRTIAFAPSKAAQKSLAESLARTLGPQGIHVSLVIVDGGVDLPRTRQLMAGKPDDFFIKPVDVADVVAHLVAQKSSAWTFEIDVRPFKESW
jgi:NAD(P)-dependent dehydrogenase (short-subunit alcohol dehydrogenase family)